MTDGKSETWIEAGLAEIARSGVEGVRVEGAGEKIPRHHQGRLLSPLPGSRSPARRHAADLAYGADCRDRKTDQPRWRKRTRTLEGADYALLGADE